MGDLLTRHLRIRGGPKHQLDFKASMSGAVPV
jgi:hypothetical protein